jgi:thiamine-monophosphate kinase
MARRRQAQSGEERLIARFFRPIATARGALGLIDDVAIWTPPAGTDLVLKTDAIVGGVHFFANDPPGAVAQKALRVNLSDLAAKGARPVGFLLALALPKGVGNAWLSGFARGLGQDARRFGCPLLGGDTDRTPGPITISIAAIGHVPLGAMVRRDGARKGDVIYVSGTIGDAALGLLMRRRPKRAAFRELSRAEKKHLTGRYLLPQPRLALASALRKFANASIDVSDGLAGDLGKLAAASGFAARIEATRVPLSRAARKALAPEPRLLQTVLSGGDDYEIVCTVPPARRAAFEAAARRVGVKVSAIGRIEAGEGVRIIGPDGELIRLARSSFSHF